jgi:hypothetical protein
MYKESPAQSPLLTVANIPIPEPITDEDVNNQNTVRSRKRSATEYNRTVKRLSTDPITRTNPVDIEETHEYRMGAVIATKLPDIARLAPVFDVDQLIDVITGRLNIVLDQRIQQIQQNIDNFQHQIQQNMDNFQHQIQQNMNNVQDEMRQLFHVVHNISVRSYNRSASRPRDRLEALIPIGQNVAPDDFPATLQQLNTLEGHQLNRILEAYGQDVAGTVEQKRNRLRTVVGCFL